MTNERRQVVRADTDGKVPIRRLTGSGHVEILNIYLRDTSPRGMAGTFFGANPPGPGDRLFVEDQCGNLTAARVAWSITSIEAVHMVGFELTETVTAM